MPARVSAGTLQIRFDDEKGLEELVEALEAATSASRRRPRGLKRAATHRFKVKSDAAATAAAFRDPRDRNLHSQIPICGKAWAILDSNQGPPPYQSGALTD